MCWRRVSKLQKTVLIVLFYTSVYVIISYAMTPEVSFTFVREDLRVGDKYSFIYLISQTPLFSDAEGADVFKSRDCGGCFLTNNKGFLPMSEYDAVLIHGDRNQLQESTAFMNPGKRFLIEATKRCVANKLKDCKWEPTITSFSTKQTFHLCGLCKQLQEHRARSDSPLGRFSNNVIIGPVST